MSFLPRSFLTKLLLGILRNDRTATAAWLVAGVLASGTPIEDGARRQLAVTARHIFATAYYIGMGHDAANEMA